MAFSNLTDAQVRNLVIAIDGAGFDANEKQAFLRLANEVVGSSTTVTAAQITDASTVGRTVLTSGNGAGLTALNATQLTTGTVPVARLPNATTSARGVVLQGVAVANAAAAPTQAEFNALLASLRTSGAIAT